MNTSPQSPPASEAANPPPSSPSGHSRVRRGRVLRDTAIGDGLVFVDGDSYPFQLERLWRSEIAPEVNMIVDVEFASDDRIASIRAVPGAQRLGDQTAQAWDSAQVVARKVASEFSRKGAPVLQRAIGQIGTPKLIAVGALVLGWYFLHFGVVPLGGFGKLSFTFYDALKILNSGVLNGDFSSLLLSQSSNPMAALSAGLYGFMAFVAVAAPLITPFLKDSRYQLADVAPLLLFGIVVVVAYYQVSSAIHAAQSTFGTNGAGGTAQAPLVHPSASMDIHRAISVLGLGAYASLLSSLHLAACGFLEFRRTDPHRRRL